MNDLLLHPANVPNAIGSIRPQVGTSPFYEVERMAKGRPDSALMRHKRGGLRALIVDFHGCDDATRLLVT